MTRTVLRSDDERKRAFTALFTGDRSAQTSVPQLFYQVAARLVAEGEGVPVTGQVVFGRVGAEINQQLADAIRGGWGAERWEQIAEVVRENPRVGWAFGEYAIDRARAGGRVESVAPERDSHLEDLFARTWDALDRPRLACPLVAQYRVGVYALDFALVAPRIAVEIDGHDFHSSPDARRHDAAKGRYLVMLGWAVFRFTGHEVANHAEECCRELYRLAVRRTAFDQPYEAIVPRGGRHA